MTELSWTGVPGRAIDLLAGVGWWLVGLVRGPAQTAAGCHAHHTACQPCQHTQHLNTSLHCNKYCNQSDKFTLNISKQALQLTKCLLVLVLHIPHCLLSARLHSLLSKLIILLPVVSRHLCCHSFLSLLHNSDGFSNCMEFPFICY